MAGSLDVAAAATHARSAAPGQSFFGLHPNYTQTLFGVVSTFASPGAVLGGVAVLQNGDVIAAECVPSGARLASEGAGTYLSLSAPITVNRPTVTGFISGADVKLKTASIKGK